MIEELKDAFEKAEELPEEKQQQIADFIEFLVTKYVNEHPIAPPQTKENLHEFLDRSVEEMDTDPKRLTWDEIKAEE